jgi:hypothetical protein
MICTVQYTVPLYNTPFKNICIIIHYNFFQYDICMMQQHTLLHHRSEVVTWKFSSQHADSCTVLLYQVIQASEQFLVYPTVVLLTSLLAFHCHASNRLWYTDSKLRITVCGDLRVHIFQWRSKFEMMEDIAQMVVIFWKPLMKSMTKYHLKKIQIQLTTQHHETEWPEPQDKQLYRQSYIFFHLLCKTIVTANILLYEPNNKYFQASM